MFTWAFFTFKFLTCLIEALCAVREDLLQFFSLQSHTLHSAEYLSAESGCNHSFSSSSSSHSFLNVCWYHTFFFFFGGVTLPLHPSSPEPLIVEWRGNDIIQEQREFNSAGRWGYKNTEWLRVRNRRLRAGPEGRGKWCTGTLLVSRPLLAPSWQTTPV